MLTYALLSAVVLVASAQTPPKSAATGPAVGSRAPDFTAINTDGRAQSLQSLLGPKGALLVFFRSADW